MHNDAANGRWLHFGNDEFYVAIQQNADHEKKRDISYKHDGMNHLGFVVTELESDSQSPDRGGIRYIGGLRDA